MVVVNVDERSLRMRQRAVLIAVVLTVLSACSSSSKPSAPSTSSASARTSTPVGVIQSGASYRPAIDPANFRAVVDNPWYPLKPGSTYIYTGVKDGHPVRDVYKVTRRTRTIDGVPCVAISDELSESGKPAERTTDYYTQDLAGNVWYFGESTAELNPAGKVTSTEGSWLAGENGARPGIFMEANPVVGHAFRQEYYAGQAEDQYQVLSLASRVKVPYGSFRGALLTQETTRLEPGALDHKYYVKGVGEVAEVAVKGAVERGLLVSYQPG